MLAMERRLRAAGPAAGSRNNWLEVAMIRVNHEARAWTPRTTRRRLGSVPEVVTHVKEVRKEAWGVLRRLR